MLLSSLFGAILHWVSVNVADPDPGKIKTSVADPDTDPNVWDRIWIRILAFINDHISTFLECVKTKKPQGIPVV
jgi:hypothetical protein